MITNLVIDLSVQGYDSFFSFIRQKIVTLNFLLIAF